LFFAKLDEKQELKKTGVFCIKTKRGHKSSASVIFPKNKGIQRKQRKEKEMK